jgi:hypothetical protein
MSNDDANPIKLRRAPSGKVFAVYRGEPVASEDGRLCYFATERDAWVFIAENGPDNQSVAFAR